MPATPTTDLTCATSSGHPRVGDPTAPGWVIWIINGQRGSLSDIWLALSGLAALGLFELFHVADGGALDARSRVYEITGPFLMTAAVGQGWRLRGHRPLLDR